MAVQFVWLFAERHVLCILAGMTVTIRIEPSGREFEAGPHETLLDAALRAGVAVQYRCAGGACGNCRARIVSGAVGETRFHDYVLDARARAAGQMLLCCTTAATDMVLETVIANGVDDIPQQEIITRVSKLDALSPEVMRVHLRTPRSHTLRFLAGQYVTLEIPGLAPRSKSIASCPCNAMHLEFHIRRAPGDAFSEFVFSKLRLQQTVVLRGPHGRFTFDEDSLRPTILVAYETGFPPIKSLIEHALKIGFNRPMHLYWMVQAGSSHYHANYCRSLADGMENFRYTALTGHPGNADATRDMLDVAQQIVKDYPDLSEHVVYSNGPPAILSDAARLLVAHRLDEHFLRIDQPQRF